MKGFILFLMGMNALMALCSKSLHEANSFILLVGMFGLIYRDMVRGK